MNYVALYMCLDCNQTNRQHAHFKNKAHLYWLNEFDIQKRHRPKCLYTTLM